ncbi:MAG: chemotaxis protein CheX [Oceanospirillaceae bacterium]|jgi:chemotaxis protein CheC|uniref:chemotaxis protein CheC n=1 Tax=Marinobacterium litorale TaxID=404770 RepID=UPI00040C5F74|nr:chemotaxis protein CheC [Marinobacterium litorale]MBS98136.1 chemotaxis protein CheX [Oceanospirillaceae bacterium]
MDLFTPDEHDLIVELMNLGVGRAANALSQLVNDEVLLSVPRLEFISVPEAQVAFRKDLPPHLAGVSQDFEGFINGRAALLFPEARSLELVNAIIGEELSADEISELEHETLAELGNILLNHCLATLANQLKESIKTDIPRAFNVSSKELSSELSLYDPPATDSLVMLVQINFSLRNSALRGYLAFIIDLNSADIFLKSLRSYLADLTG